MFWVALATAIMMLSGEGDDARAVLALLDAMREGIRLEVTDAARREAALRGVDRTQELFVQHRERLVEVGRCVEEQDSRYDATPQDYERCSVGLDEHHERIATGLAQARVSISQSLTAEEWQGLAEWLDHSEQVEDLHPPKSEAERQEQAEAVRHKRLPGLGGPVSTRHMTTPRNTLSVIVGPLSTPLFGQSYPSRTVEAGVTYGRAADGTDTWFARGGVAFGLFDDIEAGALFIPVQLSPTVAYDDILVFLTRQFRFQNFDLGARFSFMTPTRTDWAINPGLSALVHLGSARLDLGAFVPVELHDTALAGLNVPLRYTQNVIPQLYLTFETGVVSTNLSSSQAVAMPARLGVGYTRAIGGRVLDVTGLMSWDEVIKPNAPYEQVASGEVYRIVFGLTLHNKVL